MSAVQAQAVAALEWQLWWTGSSAEAECSAKSVLQHLQVNPAAYLPDLPPLQPVPLTLTVTIPEVRVTLAVEEAISLGNPAELCAQDLAVVYITSLQVRHTTPSCWVSPVLFSFPFIFESLG